MSLISSNRLLKRINRSFSSCVIYSMTQRHAIQTMRSLVLVVDISAENANPNSCNNGVRASAPLSLDGIVSVL